MTDEGRRAEVIHEYAMRQSSEPKPISRAEKKLSWADHMKEDHELHILREKIEKYMFDRTRKALMQIDANLQRDGLTTGRTSCMTRTGATICLGAGPKTADLQ